MAPPTLLPPSLEGWPVQVSHDLDAVLPDGRRRLPAAHAARAHDRGAGPDAARVHRPLRAHPRAGSTCWPTRPSSCTPGPMNRGVEIAAEVADLPSVGDHRPGAQRRGRAHGGAVPAARLGAPVGDARREHAVSGTTLVIQGGAVVDATGDAPGRRRSSTTARIVAVGRRDLDRRPTSLDAGGCVVAPGPRRPAHPPAPAGQGGGRDGRDRRPGRGARRVHRGRGHAQHRAGHRLRRAWSARCSSSGASALLRRPHRRRPSPSAGPASSSRRWPSWPTLGVRLFTDDGNGVQDDRLMRRALEYAARPRRDAGPALRGRRRWPRGGHMHEGEWSSPPRHPRPARPRPRS